MNTKEEEDEEICCPLFWGVMSGICIETGLFVWRILSFCM